MAYRVLRVVGIRVVLLESQPARAARRVAAAPRHAQTNRSRRSSQPAEAAGRARDLFTPSELTPRGSYRSDRTYHTPVTCSHSLHL